MLIPLLGALIPSLVGLAEKTFSSDQGEQKKDFVLKILGIVYDKFLSSRVPDFPGIDERALFIEIGGHLIDMVADRLFNKQ